MKGSLSAERSGPATGTRPLAACWIVATDQIVGASSKATSPNDNTPLEREIGILRRDCLCFSAPSSREDTGLIFARLTIRNHTSPPAASSEATATIGISQ